MIKKCYRTTIINKYEKQRINLTRNWRLLVHRLLRRPSSSDCIRGIIASPVAQKLQCACPVRTVSPTECRVNVREEGGGGGGGTRPS
ncbi:hypothetical protein TSAR_001917 [Trichomalopsis sarcophagae]|uniref:Uncharacterized protein n=1 Tax=Trichomalopsis sarcophagae TaxID=543379 RepID=A0A232F5Z1_9HYME|nr:hypothetical protein TSAR_001917 [Trichomalopsis sarcophagae]